MNNWQDAIVQSSESLGRAIESIDRSGAQAVMVVNENQKFIGLLTDGNELPWKTLSFATSLQILIQLSPRRRES